LVSNISPSEMSCVLFMSKDLEPFPEPFRLQRDVTFLVCYHKYQSFLVSLRPEVDEYLCRPVRDLQRMLANKDARLFNYFLEDFSYALMREIHFSQTYGLAPSYILPTSLCDRKMSVDEIIANYAYVGAEEGELLKYMKEKGYAVSPRNLSLGKSQLMYKLAVSLFYLATGKETVVEFSAVTQHQS